MTRSLFFSMEVDGKLGAAATMESAVLEVLTVPEDYTNDSAQLIAESVLNSGAIENRARAGSRGGPIRITWAALVEKGIAAGVLSQENE
ncbi:MAG: hypothetical protein ABSG17_04915 [Spirochaetia bacterium]